MIASALTLLERQRQGDLLLPDEVREQHGCREPSCRAGRPWCLGGGNELDVDLYVLRLLGGIAVLSVRGLNLSFSVSVGSIALLEIAALNDVVLVLHLNQLRDDGHDLEEAVRTGASTRDTPPGTHRPGNAPPARSS